LVRTGGSCLFNNAKHLSESNCALGTSEVVSEDVVSIASISLNILRP